MCRAIVEVTDTEVPRENFNVYLAQYFTKKRFIVASLRRNFFKKC